MGEIVQFRLRNDAVKNTGPKQQRPLTYLKTEAVKPSGNTDARHLQMVIPQIKYLYDETRIMLSLSLGQEVVESDHTIADLRKAITDGPEFKGRDRKNELEKLEEHLAVARGNCIVDNIPEGIRRKTALIDLAKFTYSKALEIDSNSLREGAVAILINAVGTREAYTIINNIQIKREIKDKQD